MKLFSFALLSLFGLQLHAQDTLIVGGAGNRIQDAWIWSYNVLADVNFGVIDPVVPELHQVLRTEVWQWEAGQDDTIRGLMQFDLADLRVDQILSAELNLWHFSNPGYTKQVGANALDLHLVTESWEEDKVTWNNQPAYENKALLSLPKSSSATQDYSQLDVTDVIKDYLKQDAHGLLLKLKEEKSFAGLSFASSEHPNALLHPTLRIIVDMESSIGEKNAPAVQVFPNPAHTLLNVSVLPGKNQRFVLMDMQGRVQLETTSSLSEVQLPIGDLPAGHYVLQVMGEAMLVHRSVIIR